MLTETITYKDFNGNERTENFHFNLTQAEVAKMLMSTSGGLQEHIQRIVAAQDAPSIIEEFEKIIKASYGVKTPDGKGFLKRPEDLEMFMATEAYSQLFMKLATDTEYGSKFVNGIMPADMVAAAAANGATPAITASAT